MTVEEGGCFGGRFFCIGRRRPQIQRSISVMTEGPSPDDMAVYSRMADMGLVRRKSSGRHRLNFRRDKLLLTPNSDTPSTSAGSRK
jgi:hypothetical protein